jgi:integrase
MKRRPKGTSCFRDRHGKLRWRFRAKGLAASYTTALFDSVEWWAWYDAAMRGERSKQGAASERTQPGSFNALVVAYLTSSDWRMLRPTTQATYRGILDRFRTEHGDKPIASLRPSNIRGILDARAGTPAAANNLLKVLRVILRFAVEREMLEANPASSVKPLSYKTDGFHTWTEAEIAAFDAVWPLGTQERLAKDLLLFTAQRSSDVRTMGRQHVQGDTIRVRQQKTGRELELPIHPALRDTLAATPRSGLTFIATPVGAPYTSAGFGNWFSDAARKAGLQAGVSAHGLRKAAARRLAEAGCSASQIAAVTGHKTLKEVSRYTSSADQRGLAIDAMNRLGGTDIERNLSNLCNRLDKTGGK